MTADFTESLCRAGSLGKTRALARRFVQPPIRLQQGIDSRIDLAALALEVADLRRDLLRRQTHLEFRLAGILSPASKDVMNLGQREPELFAVKNHLEMKPVAGILPAIGVFPSQVQRAAVLIKPEGPDAHLKIPRHFPASGQSALCIAESDCPFGTPRGNLLPASCWGFVSMENPD